MSKIIGCLFCHRSLRVKDSAVAVVICAKCCVEKWNEMRHD